MKNTAGLMLVAWTLLAQTELPSNMFGAKSASSSARNLEIEVPGNKPWTDTGLDVERGDLLRFEASGELKFRNAPKPAGPEGLARGWADMIKTYPVNDGGRGALIGRIGQASASIPFVIGAKREARASIAGRLFLGLNFSGGDSSEGSFKVKIERVPNTGAAPPISGPLPQLTQKQLDSVATRVVDKAGNVGDRTNFIIIGSEQKLRKGLEEAGWVIVDRSAKDSILTGALAVLNKKAYVTMPMSELYMFERPQDFGYAKGDPLMVVAARHHFRVWKAPFTADGATVWVGAGTHDIGFDKDQRNNSVTHKIDPETDKERDYIGQSLTEVGAAVKTAYMTPANPITKAKTAHGEEFYSDGRTLLIWLTPDQGSDASATFAGIFCSVLKQKNPDSGEWGPCTDWLYSGGKDDVTLAALKNDNRILIVPGFFNTCASDAPAFLEGQESLKKAGLTVELLSVPNNSSEDNAREIAQYLRDHMKDDKRPYLLVGYSKGTPDIQVMLATIAEIRPYVKGFISVAGAAGGSPVSDALPGMLDKYMARGNDKAGCKGSMEAGMNSLKRDVRRRFLDAYPHPFVPTYSLVAIVPPDKVSGMMKGTWTLMNSFDKENDGQLTKTDAIVPESTYLGAVKSDHFGLALPLEKSKLGGMAKPAPFPRAALLESLVRFVQADLESTAKR
jgi:hypothetical protein